MFVIACFTPKNCNHSSNFALREFLQLRNHYSELPPERLQLGSSAIQQRSLSPLCFKAGVFPTKRIKEETIHVIMDDESDIPGWKGSLTSGPDDFNT